MRSALIALLALAAAPATKPLLAPAKLREGWTMSSPAKPELVSLRASLSVTGRSLVFLATENAGRTALEGTEASLVAADGKIVQTMALPGFLPSAASLSQDGKIAAVIASSLADPNAEYSLLVFDEKGTKRFRKDVDPAYEILAGDEWIVLWTHPPLPGTFEEDEDSPPPAQAADPAVVYDLSGAVMHPGEPLGGSICRLGGGLASVTGSRLALYRPNLTRKGRADLGFATGVPFCSAGGTLVAVGDFSLDDETMTRSLLLFDGDAKKTGALRLDAPMGIDAAVAPDGKGVAATAAAADIGGDVALPGENVQVTLADRTGKILGTYERPRRDATERALFLTMSNGGARTAFVLHTADPSGAPDRVALVDARGRVLWEDEREVTGLALDPSGEWLTLADARGITRLRVKDLLAKRP